MADQLYGRLTMFYGKSDGQFDNKFTGDDDKVNYSEETAARGRLIWEPNDRLTVDTIASYREVKGGRSTSMRSSRCRGRRNTWQPLTCTGMLTTHF